RSYQSVSVPSSATALAGSMTLPAEQGGARTAIHSVAAENIRIRIRQTLEVGGVDSERADVIVTPWVRAVAHGGGSSRTRMRQTSDVDPRAASPCVRQLRDGRRRRQSIRAGPRQGCTARSAPVRVLLWAPD